MRRRMVMTACLIAVSLSISSFGPLTLAQQSAGDWMAVQSLPNDSDLSVKLKSGKTVRGEFASANDHELTIFRKGKSESIAKETIAEIYLLKRKAEKGKYAAIGAGVGAGTGLAIGGARASRGGDDSQDYAIFGTMLGAGIGAVGGLLFGQGKRKHELIYRAP